MCAVFGGGDGGRIALSRQLSAISIIAEFLVFVEEGEEIVVVGADGDGVAGAEDETAVGFGALHGASDVLADLVGGAGDDMFDADAAPEGDFVAVGLFDFADVHAGGGLDGLVGVVSDFDEHIEQGIDVSAAVFEDFFVVFFVEDFNPPLISLEEESAEHGRADEGAGFEAEVLAP